MAKREYSTVRKENEKLMNYIFGLVPYSKTSSQNSIVPWHLVILDHWFNTNRMFNWKWETKLNYLTDEQVFCFECFWLKANKEDEFGKRFFKLWNAPWYKELYKEQVLKNGKWVEPLYTCFDNEEDYELEQTTWDEYNTTFKFFEKEKRIPVKAKVTGHKLYYGYPWLPKCLKWINNYVKIIGEITFNEDIGKNRGSWKGGIIGLQYPFIKSLKNTWIDFEYNELPKYLKGEK